jgi:transposase
VAAQKRYPDELRVRAVRLWRESNPKPTFRRLGEQLGVHPEALRNWIRQDEADHGERDDRLSTVEREEMTRLRKENAELRRANEILKAASALFASELDPTRRRS